MDLISVLSIFVMSCFLGWLGKRTVRAMVRGPSALAINAVGVIIAACAAVHATPGMSQDRDQAGERPYYQTHWTISGPVEIPLRLVDGAPAAPDTQMQAQPFRIDQGRVFMASRLLPRAAARLGADLRGADGRVLVAAGSELFSLDAGRVTMFCTVHARTSILGSPNSIASALFGGAAWGRGGFKHICLIDETGDGTFEVWFRVNGLIRGLPSLSGRAPRNPESAGSVAYELVEPARMDTVYFVGIEYRGNNNLRGSEVFDVVVGIEGNMERVNTERTAITRQDLPYGREILGGRFSVVAAENDSVSVRIDQNFSTGQFGVVPVWRSYYY